MELISVIVPVHNERATLETCIERLLAVDLGAPREVIVADDGSTDGSGDVVRKIAKTHNAVRGVFQPRRRGKGAAVRAALAEARGTIVTIHDADLEYDAADIPRAIGPILEGKADAVYGSRFAAGGERRVLYYRHAIGNRIVTFLSNLMTDLNLTDVETGCKAFRRDIVKELPIRSRTFTFEIEITAKLAALGARVYEVPISYHGRSYLEGKKISWIDGIWALLTAIRFALFKDLGRDRAELRALREAIHLRRHNARVARKLLKGAGQRIVELRSNYGSVSSHFVAKERLVCIEDDPDRAALLRRRFAHRPNVTVVEGGLLDDETLDRVRAEAPDTLLSVGALSTLEDEGEALGRYVDMLEPGGRVICWEPAGRWLFSPIDRGLRRVRRYRRKRLVEVLTGAGLEVERVRGISRAATLAWLLWGTIFRRKSSTGLLAGLWDRLNVLWRILDYLLPLPGLGMIVSARKK
jgi:glycosyltransferase involved in cell wall biosynthesis